MRVNYLLEVLSGHDIRMAFAAATRCLERYRDVINSLNVFPVPDGDTGTNLLLTLRAGMDRCDGSGGAPASDVAEQLADGAFWGARGNSGVILSQFFKGFAEAMQGKGTCSSSDLRLAFQRSVGAAYQAVGTPVEGTMLSVIRAISEGVQEKADREIVLMWETALFSAREALAQTPFQLPVLREAGVVDAGGLGVVAIVGGAWCYFSSQDPETTDLGLEGLVGNVGLSPAGTPAIAREFLESTHDCQWGYCTQFMIVGERLALEQVRQRFRDIADSVVVVGNSQRLRVHVHAEDPGPALSLGVSLGQLSQIEIENMDLQNQDWAAEHRDRKGAQPGVAVVAVASGDGLARLFHQAGCSAVISGGQTMNPSVQQIMEAAQQSGGQDVIILPNNKNVVAAAEQAVKSGDGAGTLHVVPSHSVPQGVAALLAFSPEEPLEHNLKRMNAALSEVTTVEVTRAMRDANIAGMPVRTGQYIGLVDGELMVADATAETALRSALIIAGLSGNKVVTLYWGSDSTQEQAQAVASLLEGLAPGMQVDIVHGGQPFYPYLASIE